MMIKRRLLTAVFCTLALLTNGAGALLAQTQQRVRQTPPPPPEQDVLIERERVPLSPSREGFFEVQIAPRTPGDSFNFSFMSSEMHFDSKVVKGAPYSAEAITESVQTLADGNRITRTSKASLYRDSEGRTRRDQTLNHVGPWATAADDAPQTIFINDPVAGTNYTLNPRSRTALKTSYGFFFGTNRSGAPGGEHRIMIAPGSKEGVMLGVPREGEAPTQVFMRSTDGSMAGGSTTVKSAPLQGNRLAGKAIKSVPPTYPAVARAAGAEGAVTVQIVINEAGDVESAKAASGHPLLQSAAVDAARQWKFSPTQLSGNPVKVSGMISFVFSLPKGDESPAAGVSIMRAPAPGHAPDGDGSVRIASPKPVTESLGKQTIEGVEAEGTRTTITFPAGSMGNERPINIVSERWYSPELQTVVMTRHSDPRFGETNYRLTNINRSEPARTLFEVPSDYTLKAEDAHPQRLRMLSPSKVRQPE